MGQLQQERFGIIFRDRCLIGEKTLKSWRVAKGYFLKLFAPSCVEQSRLADEVNPGFTGPGDSSHSILQGSTCCTCGGILSWQDAHKDKVTGK